MAASPAIKSALELLHVPSQVPLQRRRPLPDGIEDVLRVAIGEHDALADVSGETERDIEILRMAAEFYIEQILFAPDTDSYRVLGATPQASPDTLRRHMALLVRWLHPDHVQSERTILAARVTNAWNDLKTPERRRSYDNTHTSFADQEARSEAKQHSRDHKMGKRGGRSDKRHAPRALQKHSRGKSPCLPPRSPSPRQAGSFRRALMNLLGRWL